MKPCPLNLPDCAPCPHVAVPPRPCAYWRDLEALGLPVPSRELTEIERALLDRLTAGPRGEASSPPAPAHLEPLVTATTGRVEYRHPEPHRSVSWVRDLVGRRAASDRERAARRALFEAQVRHLIADAEYRVAMQIDYVRLEGEQGYRDPTQLHITHVDTRAEHWDDGAGVLHVFPAQRIQIRFNPANDGGGSPAPATTL